MFSLLLALTLSIQKPDIPYLASATKVSTESWIRPPEGARYWQRLLPADDGRFLVFDDGPLRWRTAPTGHWSGSEYLIFLGAEVYTTSQEAHFHTGEGQLGGAALLAAFSADHALVALLGRDEGPNVMARIQFDQRGKHSNPSVPVAFNPSNGRERLLTRQDEQNPTTGALRLEIEGKRVRVQPIVFRVVKGKAKVSFGKGIELPLARDPGADPSTGGPTLNEGWMAPIVVDLARKRAIYPKAGQTTSYMDYDAKTGQWRTFGLPAGFSDYNPYPMAGLFYWKGRLLFSPSYVPNRAKPEDLGLYEASPDRKSWRKISNWRVMCVSATKKAWLLRSPDQSYWMGLTR